MTNIDQKNGTGKTSYNRGVPARLKTSLPSDMTFVMLFVFRDDSGSQANSLPILNIKSMSKRPGAVTSGILGTLDEMLGIEKPNLQQCQLRMEIAEYLIRYVVDRAKNYCNFLLKIKKNKYFKNIDAILVMYNIN